MNGFDATQPQVETSASPLKTAPRAAPDAPQPTQVRQCYWTTKTRRDAWIFLAFTAPNLVLIAVFTYWPLIANLQYSALDWT